MTDIDDIYAQVVSTTAAFLTGMGVPDPNAQAKRIVNWTQVRNAVIKTEYRERIGQGEKAAALWRELGEKYDLSWHRIEAIIRISE